MKIRIAVAALITAAGLGGGVAHATVPTTIVCTPGFGCYYTPGDAGMPPGPTLMPQPGSPGNGPQPANPDQPYIPYRPY